MKEIVITIPIVVFWLFLACSLSYFWIKIGALLLDEVDKDGWLYKYTNNKFCFEIFVLLFWPLALIIIKNRSKKL